MALANFATFVVLKILDNFVSLRDFLNVKQLLMSAKFRKLSSVTLSLLQISFRNLAFILPSFEEFWLKRIVLASYKIDFIKNEGAIMQKHAIGFVVIIYV